jgi:asparagine synthetase B (glutamine-hydrolysing)
MCGIIAAVIKNPTKEDFETLKRVFIESKIRGMHATGISFLPAWSDKVVTIKDSIPADKFADIHLHPDNMKDFVSSDGVLYLVGHCRYSTSDLEFNQPLANETKSIVHNGVITQELPENWKELYGYECMTKNDSELVLHSDDALREFSHMSMGVVELYLDKKIRVYRNGKRPLYLTTLQNGNIITSTSDIARRSGLDVPMEVPMNLYMTIDGDLTVQMERVLINDEFDFQKVEYETVHI